MSLIEVVISITMVAVILVGALNCVAAVARGRGATSDLAQSEHLVQQLLSEILEQEYEEPNDAISFGREGTESATSRANWDDVDDYHLWSASPPQDRSGTPLPNLTGWQRDVVVERIDPIDPSTLAPTESGLKRITVIVRRNGTVIAQGVALRSGADK